MVKKVFIEEIQSPGLVIGDKMYLVPLRRQRLAELCRYHTTPAKGRITNYSYSHDISF
jgi:hypothetical protein